MAEPFSIGAIGMLAASEGIKFLYSQATAALQRWRARKDRNEESSDATVVDDGAKVLDRPLDASQVDYQALERLGDDIKALRSVLDDYANDFQEPDPSDDELVAAADSLRRALEAVYSQRITFKGEQRPPTLPTVVGEAEVDEVVGEVAGVRARLIKSGRIRGTFKARRVGEGGKAAGVWVDEIR